jgi:glyoxylase-like metal-dependent hydrolase (beta-lactamase superfamily II)
LGPRDRGIARPEASASREQGVEVFAADVADGVHRVEDSHTNWYIVEDEGRLTVVDAGVPTSWGSFLCALTRLGRRTDQVEALVLTHAHFDHVGFAERARRELRVPVYVHENDAPLTMHPWRYDHERSRALHLATHAGGLPYVATFARNRAFVPRAIREIVRFENGTLPVPGSPRVIPTPGHTLGHCALYFEDRDCVIAGDAVVTLDPYTGRRGPRLVSRAATADSTRNLATLDGIAETEASTVLVGHGEPWSDGAEALVARARSAGAA